MTEDTVPVGFRIAFILMAAPILAMLADGVRMAVEAWPYDWSGIWEEARPLVPLLMAMTGAFGLIITAVNNAGRRFQ